jgi:hypothetical protein
MSRLELDHLSGAAQTRRGQVGIMADAEQVVAHRLGGRARGQHGPTRRLEVQWQKTCCNPGGAFKHHPSQEAMYSLRVKRRERVGGIGLKTEQLASPPRPGGPAGMRLVQAQGPGHHTPIAETMKDRATPLELEAPQDMSVVSDHDIRTCIDGSPSNRPLVGGEAGRYMNDSLVESDDTNIRSVTACLSHILLHECNRSGVRLVELRSWSNWPPVLCGNANISAAGPGRCCPARLGPNTVVAEQRHTHPPASEPRRRPSQRQRHCSACMCNPILIEAHQGVPDAFGSAVGNVVAGQRHGVESCA